MKKAIYIIAAWFALSTSSCTLFDDYLDIVPKGQQIIESVKDFSEMLNNENFTFYTINNIATVSDNTWTNPQAYFQNASTITIGTIHFMYLADPVTYNRYTYLDAVNTGDYTSYYNIISRYNIVLEYIDEAKGDETLRKVTRAEAKLMRAFRHFYLVNIYAPNYNPATAATDLAIPIRDRFDLEKAMTQSTVEQVYKFIEKDIEEALPDLSNTPVNVYHPSLAAGYALKAKVHFQKREYAKAKEAALKSYELNSQLFDLVSFIKNDAGRVTINATQPENLLFGMTSNTDRPYISPSMVALYKKDADDCRFDPFFFKQDVARENNFDDNEYISRWQVEGTVFAKNTMGLTTAEVRLILAECYVREGDFNKAMTYVNELREKRIKNYSQKAKPSPAGEAEAMQIVIEERQKEFPFGFSRLLDLRRLGNDPKYAITATRLYPANPNSVWSSQKEYKLTPGSYLLTAPLPIPVLNQDTYMNPTTPELYSRR